MVATACAARAKRRIFGAVESPHGLGVIGVHVHGLRAVAPAGGHGDGGSYALALELLGAGGAFRHAPDGAVGDDALHGTAVPVLQVVGNQLCHGLCQVHGLLFEAFAHASLPAVNGRADTDFRVLLHGC